VAGRGEAERIELREIGGKVLLQRVVLLVRGRGLFVVAPVTGSQDGFRVENVRRSDARLKHVIGVLLARDVLHVGGHPRTARAGARLVSGRPDEAELRLVLELCVWVLKHVPPLKAANQKFRAAP